MLAINVRQNRRNKILFLNIQHEKRNVELTGMIKVMKLKKVFKTNESDKSDTAKEKNVETGLK